MEARLKEKYKKEIKNALKEELKLENIMEVPKIAKIVINMGVGKALENKTILDSSISELGQITGQRPVKTFAKKSISNFKLRKGNPIGCCVTLRGNIMYEFLDRLVNVALPRVRDFKGISPKSFDGRGNYTLGVKEQTIFPEIRYDKVDSIKGMDITIVTTAKTDEQSRVLLEKFGLPFKK